MSPAVSGRIVDNRETDAVRKGRSGDHRRRRLFRQRANRSNGYYYSSHVAAGNKIYLASEEGVLVVLDGGEELKVLARSKLDGPILATPAIVDGKIYVRTEDHLYAFGR